LFISKVGGAGAGAKIAPLPANEGCELGDELELLDEALPDDSGGDGWVSILNVRP